MRFQAQRGFCRFFIPRYDEIVLFAMSLTCIVLLTSGLLSFHGRVELLSPREFDPRLVAAGFIFLAGLVLSLSHVFVPRPASPVEKSFMLFFAVLLNAFSGFMGGGYDLTHAQGWHIIFPLVNMANSVVLLFLWRGGAVDETCISDQRAPKGQVVLATGVVLLLFFLCHVVYRLIWIETLSICIVYSTNLIKLTELITLRRPARGAAA
jgi:hypothetical protein